MKNGFTNLYNINFTDCSDQSNNQSQCDLSNEQNSKSLLKHAAFIKNAFTNAYNINSTDCSD